MSQDDYNTDERHIRAEVRRFKQHLLTYCTVIGLLFAINLFTGGIWEGDFWFLWVAFFWGIAIAFQAARLFGDDVGREWEDRTVARIMERRHGRPYTPPPPPSAAPKPAAGGPSKPRRAMHPEPVSDYVPPEPPTTRPSAGAEAEEKADGASETKPSSDEAPNEPPPAAA